MRLMQRWMGLRPVRFGGALLLALVVVTGYMTLFPPAARGVSSTVVISEFRTRGPGGGNDEFIELYNLSSSPVNIGNWKIKGSNGNNPPFVSTRVTINPGITLNPGCHYLLTNSASGGYSGLVPGNQTYTTGITDDGGIALTLPDDTIVDQVGMSANSAFKEGAILAPLTTNLNRSYERKPGGTTGSGTDTDNNANDFQLISPSDPQNLSSTCLGVSSNPAGVGSANPNSVAAGGSTLLTVTVTPGTNPTSTGLTVSGDLTAIGGGFSQGFFDDGTHGDVTAGDSIFSFQATVSASAAPGAMTLPVTITDVQLRTGRTSIPLTVTGGPTNIVISQIYGGGGNNGAAFKNDFIELFNRGSNTVKIGGWSVQYSSALGTTWQVTAITSGSLAPGQYFLVQEAAGSAGTINLPIPDATGSIGMSATAGKIALVNNTTALSGACPSSTNIIDLVGYGTSASCSEGGSPTANPSDATAALRKANGCTDTNNNGADFFVGTPNPHNSASLFRDCSSTPAPTKAIYEIQGSGTSSLLAGQKVTTTDVIVTGLKSNGFFIQTPDGNDDGNPSTSEGLFVFTGSPRPSAPIIGDLVSITGTVSEFIPSSDPSSPPVTELTGPVSMVLSSGNTLPQPVTLTADDTSPAGSIEQLEKFEGMRVHVNSLTVVGPTQGFINEANATSTSSGIFFGVISGVARPFREPGIEIPDPLPAGSPCCVPRFDANPERLRVDSDAQPGAAALEVTAGAVVSNLTGPLDYGSRAYTILPDPPPAPSPVVSGMGQAVAVPIADPDELTIASFNMERFFDTVNDPLVDDVALTSDALNRRLAKASLAIRNVMRSPDIIGVEEMENLPTLQAVANQVNSDVVLAGQGNPGYQAYLIEGNDVGGIDVGFLVKSSRVSFIDVKQEGKNTTYINPNTGLPELLNDRPPLVLRARLDSPADPPFPITVIVNHLRSLSGIDDPADGNRVRSKRRAQAEFLASLVQARQQSDPNEKIVLVGDFNSFQFNDGYVDTIGTIKGISTASEQVVLASGDLVNPDLTDLVDLASSDQRYSFNFDGNAQVLDHVLTSGNILGKVTRFAYARNNADFPESFRNNPARPERISDHDMPVAYFTTDVTAPATTATASPGPISKTDITVTLTATDNTGGSGVKEIQYASSGITVGGGTFSGSSGTILIQTEGTTTITFKSVDKRNNMENSQTLVVRIDRTPPLLTCPVDIIAEATSGTGATVNYPAATATDAGPVTLSYSQASGTFPLGSTTIKVTATDAAGNKSTCSFSVTVRDTTPPVVKCPVDLKVEATSSEGAKVNYPSATATDAVSVPVLDYSKATGTTFPIGASTVKVTATDAAGNSSSCSFTVMVLGPQGIKSDVRAELVAVRSTVHDKQDGDRLDDAIRYLASSLDSVLWVDQSHLDPEKGDHAFNEEKNAVNILRDLLKNRKSALPDVVLQGFINRIVIADRVLAAIAAQEATAAGGDQKEIDKAREELAGGDADAVSGQYESAIEHYRNAWQHAQQAVKKS